MSVYVKRLSISILLMTAGPVLADGITSQDRADARAIGRAIAENALRDFADEVVTVHEDADGNTRAGVIPMDVEGCHYELASDGHYVLDGEGNRIEVCETYRVYFDPTNINPDAGMMPSGSASGSLSPEDLQRAYDESTGSDGKYLDARGDLGRDTLRSECDPDVHGDDRSSDCDTAASIAFRMFEDSASTRLPDLSSHIPIWFANTETVYDEFVGQFAEDFQMCDTGHISYSSSGQRMSYTIEERSCYELNTWEGQCEGTQEIEMKLVSLATNHNDTYWVDATGFQRNSFSGYAAIFPGYSPEANFYPDPEFLYSGSGIGIRRSAELEHGFELRQRLVGARAERVKEYCGGSQIGWLEHGNGYNATRFAGFTEDIDLLQYHYNVETAPYTNQCVIAGLQPSEMPDPEWNWNVESLTRIAYPFDHAGSSVRVLQQLDVISSNMTTQPCSDGVRVQCELTVEITTHVSDGDASHKETQLHSFTGASGYCVSTDTLPSGPVDLMCNPDEPLYLESLELLQNKIDENDLPAPSDSMVDVALVIGSQTAEMVGTEGYCQYQYDTATVQQNSHTDEIIAQWASHRTFTANEVDCTTGTVAPVCDAASVATHSGFQQWGDAESLIDVNERFEGYCGMEWSVRSEIIDPHGNVVESHDAPAQLYGNSQFTCRADGFPACSLASNFQHDAVIWPDNPFVASGYRAPPRAGDGGGSGFPATEYRQVVRVGDASGWAAPPGANRFGGAYGSRRAEQSVALRVDNPDAIERVTLMFVVHDDDAMVRINDAPVWVSDPLEDVTATPVSQWLPSLTGCAAGSTGIPSGATTDTGDDDHRLGGGTYLDSSGEPTRNCSGCSVSMTNRYSETHGWEMLRDTKGGEYDRFIDYELTRSFRKTTNQSCETQTRTRDDGSEYTFTACYCNPTTSSSASIEEVVVYQGWSDPEHTIRTTDLNIDVTEHFRGINAGDTVQLQMLVGAGVNSGGFFQLAVDYDPTVAVTQHVWGPDHCIKGAVDIGSGWATGNVQCVSEHVPSPYEHCVQVPLVTHDGQVTTTYATVCEPDLMSSIHQGMPASTVVALVPNIEWKCRRFEADIEYTFAGNVDNDDHQAELLAMQCSALEDADNCERVTRFGANNSCLAGARDEFTGLCQVSRIDYECKTNPIPVPTDIELSLACNDAVLCEDGSCQDALVSQVSSMEEFSKAALMLAVAESGSESMKCTDPDDINTCGLFPGSAESCARRMTNIRPCQPGDEATRPECSDDNDRDWDRWEDPSTGTWLFDAGNDCCDERLDASEDTAHALTQWMRDALDAKAKAELYGQIDVAMEFHTMDGFEYLSDRTNEDDPTFFYSEMSDYLVAYESSLHGRTDPADDVERASAQGHMGQQINNLLENVFGDDYGATIVGVGRPALEYVGGQAAESLATSVLGETAVGAIAGPLGTAMALRSAAEFVVGLLTACDHSERQLWLDRRMGTCTRVGDGHCREKVPFTNFCSTIEQEYCCYESVLARLVQEAARGNRLGVRSFDDPAIPGLDFDPVYRGWRGPTVGEFPIYERRDVVDENGKSIIDPATGEPYYEDVQVGTEVREDIAWLCHEPLTMEQLAEMDWGKVKLDQYIDFLYRTGQVPTDEFGNPLFGMELTGTESRLQFDESPDRLDAAQRALQRLDIGVDASDIRASADETFELEPRPASRPWYQDYDAVLCEYDQDGVAPNDRFSCTHIWAPEQCDNHGYLAHGVCAFVHEWANDCSPADLSITLNDRCQEFRSTFCGMDRYGAHNVESCGVMGDAQLMQDVASCEAAPFWGFISNHCLVDTADQVCDHGYFSSHAICNPTVTGPVSERADRCLMNPIDYECYELKMSIACHWTEFVGHPICTIKPWDGNTTAEQCEFVDQEGGHFRDRLACVTWASNHCGNPENHDHQMCQEVDLQMSYCDITDLTTLTGNTCQERRALYCDHERFSEHPLCQQPGDKDLVDAYLMCENAGFELFASNQCQSVRAELCQHAYFTNANLCNRLTQGSAASRAGECDSSELSVLTSGRCREFRQSPACDWPGWTGQHPACLNEIASFTDLTCSVEHDIEVGYRRTGASINAWWDDGQTTVVKGHEYFGFDGSRIDSQCNDTSTFAHNDDRSTDWMTSGSNADRTRRKEITMRTDFDNSILADGVSIEQRVVNRRATREYRGWCPPARGEWRCHYHWDVETRVFDHEGNVIYDRTDSRTRTESAECRSSGQNCTDRLNNNNYPRSSWIDFPY